MRDPFVFRVQAFDQHMRPDVATLDEQWTPFWASLECHGRIIARTQAFDLREPLHRVDTALAPLELRYHAYAPIAEALKQWRDDTTPAFLHGVVTGLPPALQQEVQQALRLGRGGGSPLSTNGNGSAPALEDWAAALDLLGTPLWKRRWLKAERQMYEDFQASKPMRGLHHYVFLWLPENARPETYLAGLESTFDTGVFLSGYPSFVPCVYREHLRYLEPVDDRALHPYVTVLVAYDLKGTWDISTLHRILVLDMDLAIALDIGHIPRARAEWIADFAAASRMNKLQMGGPRDVRAERQLQAALQLQEILDSQALHDLLLVVAVFGATPEELEVNVSKVESEGGQRLRLERPVGAQKELLKFFGASHRKEIACPIGHRRVPSRAIAVATPFGLRKPDRTDGPLWMVQGDTPILFNPFANKKAAHAIIFGETGYGKTFAINAWAMRMLLQGVQIVLYEPQGHSRRPVAAAGRGGARYILSMQQQLNPLDVMVTRGESGQPPSVAQQAEIVASNLAVLLGTTKQEGEKVTFVSRVWSPVEAGLLALALEQLYRPFDLETLTTDRTPLLQDLCDALSDQNEPEAKAIAREIHIALVRGPNRTTFNAQTSIDWHFTHDMTAYDFSEIPSGVLQTFYYMQAFGALNRFVRSKQRDSRKTLVAMIDEFGYMMKASPSLVTFVAMAVKTWRTFGAHFWTIDQNAHTYLEGETGALLTIFQNAPLKAIMRQGRTDAELLEKAMDGLRPSHIDHITHLKRGECVLVWQSDSVQALHDEVYEGYVYTNDEEFRAFSGT